MKRLPELVPMEQDCSSAIDEANTIRQELSALVVEVREFALQLKSRDQYFSDEIADILLNIVRGDPR